jgi:hypothetical protein
MNKALLATAACAALGVAAAAQAAVTVQIVDKGVPANGSTVATGYHGYVIRLVSDSGAITAVDASTGAFGITGKMVQRWTDSDGDDVPEVRSPGYLANDNSTGNANNFDSHYLSHPANPANPNDPFNADAVSPNESLGTGGSFGPPGANPPFPNNVSNGPFVGVGGPDGTLKVSVGIKAFAQATTFDLAYVVLPNNATDSFTASVATANGTFPVAATFPVPEPTTLSLAGLGALGMLARRRRA